MAHDTPSPTTAAASATGLRRNMQTIARTLGLPLGEAEDAGLAFRIRDRVSATVAPGRSDRLVAILRVAEVQQVPSTLWISALSEAAGWGLEGERQRFVVLDGHLALLWTTPELPDDELLDRLYGLFATAVALAEAADTAPH